MITRDSIWTYVRKCDDQTILDFSRLLWTKDPAFEKILSVIFTEGCLHFVKHAGGRVTPEDLTVEVCKLYSIEEVSYTLVYDFITHKNKLQALLRPIFQWLLLTIMERFTALPLVKRSQAEKLSFYEALILTAFYKSIKL